MSIKRLGDALGPLVFPPPPLKFRTAGFPQYGFKRDIRATTFAEFQPRLIRGASPREFWIASAYLSGPHRLQPRHGMRRTGSFLSDKRRLHQPHPGEVCPNSMPGCIFSV